MKIVQATAEDAVEIHTVQVRYLGQEPEVAAFQKTEGIGSIQHFLRVRTCLKAEHRGTIVGIARGQDQGQLVYIDALWVPDFALRQGLCVRLLLELENYFPTRETFHIRAAHRDAKCYRVYPKAGYVPFFEDRKRNGIVLRLYEKRREIEQNYR